jgi:hypothetical protein
MNFFALRSRVEKVACAFQYRLNTGFNGIFESYSNSDGYDSVDQQLHDVTVEISILRYDMQ